MKRLRRQLLVGLAALAVLPRSAFPHHGSHSGQEAHILNQLKGLISSRASALVIGTEVLKCASSNVARCELVHALMKHNASDFRRARSKQQLALCLRDAILRDFDHGRTLDVDGLVLANTEATLCALIACDAMTQDE